MMRKLLPLIGATTIALVGCSEPPPSAPPPLPEVLVADVVQRDVPVTTELVGQAVGFQDVEVRARVEGFLEKVAFTEGTLVRTGQLLYEIDRKPLEAARANAKANLATWEARLEKTRNDVRRLTPLAAQQAVSQQELDNAVAAQEAAAAQVDAQKAAVDNADINLGYTTVRSPIDGLIGTTRVKAGNLVGRGENTLLVTISQIDPILFRAGIAEADYLRIARRFQADQAAGTRSAPVPIHLVLADGTEHPHTGRLDAVERNVDAATGTIALQIRFPNPQRLLRPGQYGRLRFDAEVRQGALLVPQRAVQELQNLYSLAIVGPDNKVSFRNVKVGPRIDSHWVIEEGLQPGDKVVVEGLQRIRDGVQVNPKPMPVTTDGSGDAAGEPAAPEVR